MWAREQYEQLPVLLHTWGHDIYADCPHIEKFADTYSRATITLGHAQYGDWDGGIELARRFPNMYLELCAAYHVNGSVTRMVNEGVQNKILYGDDLPWFNPHYGIGFVLFSRISDAARHAILHKNAELIFER